MNNLLYSVLHVGILFGLCLCDYFLMNNILYSVLDILFGLCLLDLFPTNITIVNYISNLEKRTNCFHV